MNLLVTGAWPEAKENIPALERMGHSVSFMQYEKDRLPCDYGWVEGVVCNGLFLSHPIEKFKNLKYIQLTSAGLDRVPADFVKEHNIEIHNAGGVYSIPMAEFALSGVLHLYKQMRFFLENQKKHVWEKHRGLNELYGKTVCIAGCGSVGTECARRFSAFGCRVVGVDLYPRDDPDYAEMLRVDEIDGILPETDVLVLSLPLNGETKHFIGSDRIAKLRRDSVLVNISRGGY